MKTISTTIAAFLVASSASAATIDFEGLAAGTVVTDFDVAGVTGDVRARRGPNSDHRVRGSAMVFDTGNPTGGDVDLGAPFYSDFDSPGVASQGADTLSPGNVLIVSEDNDSSDPDDNGNGGIIRFFFDTVVNITGFDVFDDVDNMRVTARNADDERVGREIVDLDFDNQFASFSVDWLGVTSLTFDFGGASGAIDNIDFDVIEPAPSPVPVPASLPLMIAGLAGLGFASRRRKAR